LTLQFGPGKHQSGAWVLAQLAAFPAFVIRKETEAALVNAAEQDRRADGLPVRSAVPASSHSLYQPRIEAACNHF
jgi:hypothetical protein